MFRGEQNGARRVSIASPRRQELAGDAGRPGG
jgi:hypothetical protein